ncbi:MAG: Hsp20/alpha crystallin family protein [Leptospiraceae bacterium]|nr:Hsp20/alpha crystallin family protein [Leptospiraceae bacterium]MCK6380553.1 Hsp20/alpha crystallin family protein [Leptospiraceae bacterium]NUM41804.1 Hsp20/alpha crystallin family protein [Leptospiraceae bacterium]
MVQELVRENTENSVKEETKRLEFVPDVNIYESENTLILFVDMPGVDEKSVDITLNEDILSIQGKTSLEIPKEYKRIYSEYRIGDFKRDFKVSKPVDLENAEAVMKNGQLKLTLKKLKPEARKIAVKSE